MNENEINKTIAEYVGCNLMKVDGVWCIEDELTATHPLYTHSLDALVSVWEKLGVEPEFSNHDGWDCSLYKHDCDEGKHIYGFLAEDVGAETIQLAAAKATALAIKELEGK